MIMKLLMKWIIPSFPRLSTSSSLWVKVMVKLPMNWPDDLGNKIWNQHPWIQRVPGFSHNIPKEQKGTNLLIVKFHECYMCGMAAWWFFSMDHLRRRTLFFSSCSYLRWRILRKISGIGWSMPLATSRVKSPSYEETLRKLISGAE